MISNGVKSPLLFLTILLLCGCAAYKFQSGSPPYDKGYMVSREDFAILEYTAGKHNTVPELKLAKERFKRRKAVVEDYYKRMGYIENRFKEQVFDRVAMFVKLVGSVFALPGRLISASKYENNPKYREKIDKLEAQNINQEEARIKKLKEELQVYIKLDLSKEE